MTAPDTPADVTSDLLALAEVRLHELLAGRDRSASSTLDGVMRRLVDQQAGDRLTISRFASSL